MIIIIFIGKKSTIFLLINIKYLYVIWTLISSQYWKNQYSSFIICRRSDIFYTRLQYFLFMYFCVELYSFCLSILHIIGSLNCKHLRRNRQSMLPTSLNKKKNATSWALLLHFKSINIKKNIKNITIYDMNSIQINI